MAVELQISNYLLEGRWTSARETALRATKSPPSDAILPAEVLLPIRVATSDAPIPIIKRSLDHYFRNPVTSTAAGLTVTADAFFVNRRFSTALALGQAAFVQSDETTKCLSAPQLVKMCLRCNQPAAAEHYLSEAWAFAAGRIDTLRLAQVASEMEMQRGDPLRAMSHLEDGENASDPTDIYAEKQYQTAFSTVDLSLGNIGHATSAIGRALDATTRRDPELPADSSDAILATSCACIHYLSSDFKLAQTFSRTSVEIARGCLDAAALLDALLLDVLVADDQFLMARNALSRDLDLLGHGGDPFLEAYLAPTKALVTALYARGLARRGNLSYALAQAKDAAIQVRLGNDSSAVERVYSIFRNIVAQTAFSECAGGADHLGRVPFGFRPASYVRKDGPIWN